MKIEIPPPSPVTDGHGLSSPFSPVTPQGSPEDGATTTTISDQENRTNLTPTPTSKVEVDTESIVCGFGNRRDLWEKTSKSRTPSGLTPMSSRQWASPSPSPARNLKFGNGTKRSQFSPKVNPQQQQVGNKSGYDDNNDSAEPTFGSLRSKWESEAQVKTPRGIGGSDRKFQSPKDQGNYFKRERAQDGVAAERGKRLSVSNDIDTSADTQCQHVQSHLSEMCGKEGNGVKEAVNHGLQEPLQEESNQFSELKTNIDPIDVPLVEDFSFEEDQNTEIRSANQDKVEGSIGDENGSTKVKQMMILEDKDTYLTDLDNLLHRHKENLPYRHNEAPSSDEEDHKEDVEETHPMTDEEQKRIFPSEESSLEALSESFFSVEEAEDDRTAKEKGALVDVVSGTEEEANETDAGIAKVPNISLDLQSIENVDETVYSEENEIRTRRNPKEVETIETTKDGLENKEISKTDSSWVPTTPSSILLPANKVVERDESTSKQIEAAVTERYDEGECNDVLNHKKYDPEAVEKVVTTCEGFLVNTVDNIEDTVNQVCRVSNLDGAETNEKDHLAEDETSHTSSEECSSDMMEYQFSDDMMDPLQQSEVRIPKDVNNCDPSQVMTDQAESEVTQSCLKINDENGVLHGSVDFHDTDELHESAAEDSEETDANETDEENESQDRIKEGTEQERSLKEEYYDRIGGLVAKKVSFEDSANEDDRRQLSGEEYIDSYGETIETSREQSPTLSSSKDEFIESYGETADDDTERKPRRRSQSPSSMSFRSKKDIWEERASRNSPANGLFEHGSFSFESGHFINPDADQIIQNEHIDGRPTSPEPDLDCDSDTEPQQKSKQNDTSIIKQNAKQNKKEGELESSSITTAPSTDAEHFSRHRANSRSIGSVESSSLLGSSVEIPPDAAPVPNPKSIVAKGPVYSRTSLRTIVLKKWHKSFFVQYGATSLYLFRSKEDFGDWLQNPFLSQKQRDYLVKLKINFMEEMTKPNVRGYKLTDLKAKVYERNGPKMHNFKLEKWMDLGPSIAAAFASPQKEEVTKLRNVISNCLRKCPKNGLRSIDNLLVK